MVFEKFTMKGHSLSVIILPVFLTLALAKPPPRTKCEKPPNFYTTKMIGEFPEGGVKINDKINLQCQERYYQQTVVSMCHDPEDPNGWTLPDPECQLVECREPSQVQNGHIKFKNRYYMDRVVYSCEEGYWYTGPITRTCQRDGTWSGYRGICAGITCDDPPVLNHGAYSPHPNNKGTASYSPFGYRDTVKVICEVGYINTGTEELSCFEHNKWNGTIGRCININDVHCPYPKGDHIMGPSKNESFGYNASIIMACIKGYAYFGPHERYCLATGSWSGSKGECKKIICSDFPDELENGRIFTCDESSCKYGDCMKFNCSENYKYNGSIPKCGKDGKWKGTLGSCLFEVEESMATKISSATTAGIVIGIILALILILSVSIGLALKKRLLECCSNAQSKQQNTYTNSSGEPLIIPEAYKERYETWDHDAQSLSLLEWRNSDGAAEQYSDIKKRMTELFDQNGNGTILIHGKAGVGKSTMALDIMRIFTQMRENVFFLNLRYLINLGTKSEMSMDEILLKHSIHKHQNGKYRRKSRKEYLEKDGENHDGEKQTLLGSDSTLMIFIDSLDEFPNFLKKWKENVDERNKKKLDGLTWVVKILKREVLKNIQLVISTRPFDGMDKIQSEHEIEVLGLSPDTLDDFIKLNTGRKKKMGVREKIESHPILNAMSYTPLICSRICRGMGGKDSILSDNSPTYKDIVLFVIKTLVDWEYDQEEDRRKEAIIAIFNELPKLAYQGYVGSPNECTTPGIHESNTLLFNDKTDTSEPAGLESGLLIFENSNHKFIHPSIECFLAMVYMVQQSAEVIKTFFKTKWQNQSTSKSLLYLFGLVSVNRDTLKSLIDDITTTEEKIVDNRKALFTFLFNEIQKEKDISRHDQLKAIQFIYESQSKVEAKRLCEILFPVKEETYIEVDFQDVALTDVDIYGIVFMMEQLQHDFNLRLEGLDMDILCQRKLADFLKENKYIQKISFKSMTFADEGTKEILKAIARSSSLKSCSWQSMHLYDRMMEHVVEALQENRNIQYLCLQKNRFTEVAVKQLADSLHNRTEPLILRLDKEDDRMEEELKDLTVLFGEEEAKPVQTESRDR